MAAAMNGIALHGGFIPYGGTFLVFADYSRPAIRLAALMGMRVIHVMTHDSIGLGEDGPTHQPVEHLASLRAIPNLLVFRPADAVETAEAWECALRAAARRRCSACRARRCRPSAAKPGDRNRVARGAYVLLEPDGRARRHADRHRLGGRDRLRRGACSLAQGIPRRRRVGAMLRTVRAPSRATIAPTVLGAAPRIGIEAAVEGDWDRWLGETASSSA